MKHVFLTILLFTEVLLLRAQMPKDTLYGFEQHISRGIQKAGDIDENGNLIRQKMPPVSRHTIYLATATKTRIYPVQLWINGEAFSVKWDTLTHPPVVTSNVQSPITKAKPLFPETAGTIYQLTPIPLVAKKGGNKGLRLAKDNAVVLQFSKAGKMHYEVLKKFTELEPVSLQ